jgi:hypothetical protein
MKGAYRMIFSLRSFVALFAIVSTSAVSSMAIASPAPSWSLAPVSRAVAGSQSNATYIVQAWATLPNPCYNSRILRQVGTNINVPRYYVQEILASSATCPMNSMKAKMVVHCTPRLVVTPDISKTIVVESMGSTPSKPKIWTINVAPKPPTGYVACPHRP